MSRCAEILTDWSVSIAIPIERSYSRFKTDQSVKIGGTSVESESPAVKTASMPSPVAQATKPVAPHSAVRPMRRRRGDIVEGGKIERIDGGTIVRARGLELKTLMGCPYSGIDLDIEQGKVYAVRGHNGSGKTSLLLTLAGRMAFTKGSLNVLGYDLPKGRRHVQRQIGLGLFEGLNDLQDSLTVSYVVASEFELYGRKVSKEAIKSYLVECDLTDFADTRVNDLTTERRIMLGVALAWVGHPKMIVVDDIEDQLTKDQSQVLMDELLNLAHARNVSIVVGVVERDLAEQADGALYLEKEGE